jgi:hypothetical protein
MVSSLERMKAAEAAQRRVSAKGSERDGVAPAEDYDQPVSRRYVRTDPVRCTVDLLPAQHVKWSARCDEASLELGMQPGRRGVTSNAGLLALVRLLEVDATVRERWIQLLAKENIGAGRRGSVRRTA